MNEKFKDLAILYFEGRLTPNQECEFFGFIAADPENAAQMREWECEWKRQHTPSANVLGSGRRKTKKPSVPHWDERLTSAVPPKFAPKRTLAP